MSSKSREKRAEAELHSLRDRVGLVEATYDICRKNLEQERRVHGETGRLLRSCLGMLNNIPVSAVRSVMSLGAFEDLIRRATTQVSVVDGSAPSVVPSRSLEWSTPMGGRVPRE